MKIYEYDFIINNSFEWGIEIVFGNRGKVDYNLKMACHIMPCQALHFH